MLLPKLDGKKSNLISSSGDWWFGYSVWFSTPASAQEGNLPAHPTLGKIHNTSFLVFIMYTWRVHSTLDICSHQ